LVWTAGSIVLVTLGASMLDTLAPDVFGQSPALSEVRYEDGAISNASSPSLSSLPDAGASTSEVLTLIAIWTTIVVVAFFIIGDGAEEGFHKNYVFPYRSVLTTFTLVILLIVLANIMAHSATNLRVQSLNAPAALISRTSTNLAQAAGSVSESGTNLGLLLEASKVPPDFMADNQQAVLVWRSKQFDQIRKLGNDLAQDAGSMSAYAVAAGNQMDSALALVEGDAARTTAQEELEAVHAVLQQTVGPAIDLKPEIATLKSQLTDLNPGNVRSLDAVGDTAAGLSDVGNTVSYGAGLATSALNGLDGNATALVLWLCAFYASFVLFPWVLLIMFLYRKRRRRADEIVADLKRLDPSPNNGLMYRALGISEPGLASNAGSAATKDLEIGSLLDRAFSNREYVLGATLLTVLTAAGWYYFLYPMADVGMSNWVVSDAGIKKIGEDLAENASPLTMGFAGAYFFVSHMLLRRYLSGDLYPSAYIQSALRIIWVFTLSVALAVLFLFPGNEAVSPTQVALVAFVAGVFPSEGFRLISTAVSGFVRKVVGLLASDPDFSKDTGDTPITKLDGVDIWVENRLLEENIESVQGMATAPIEQLVIGTYYPAARIVDWVDQAILFTHCGENFQWWDPLHGLGIRTATDFLDAAGFPMSRSQALSRSDFSPKDANLDAIAQALVAAGGNTSGPTREVLREMCLSMWPDPNLRYVLAYKVSVTDKDLSPVRLVTMVSQAKQVRENGQDHEFSPDPGVTAAEEDLIDELQAAAGTREKGS
jgi:hypothetical protein